MSLTDTVQVGSRTVTVRELRVAEVRAWFDRAASGRPVDPMRRLVLPDCSLDDLAMMTDCPAEVLEEEGTESELSALRDVCKRLNGFFFRTRAAMDAIAREMDTSSLLRILTEASPSSPDTATPTS